jgi:hypothetical protein
MSLDDLHISEDPGGVGQSSEAPSEVGEKQRAAAKKAQVQLQKTQKDERKAKIDSDEIFHILSKFIQNPLYEECYSSIIALLQAEYPSRFALAITALVYPEASYFLFSKTGRDDEISRITQLYSY